MPGSGNFVGEILILLGLFKTKMVFSIIAFTGVVMASVYMLRAFIRTMHNRAGPEVARASCAGATRSCSSRSSA
jgi:NADH-quinone oxidoreductase subunit M